MDPKSLNTGASPGRALGSDARLTQNAPPVLHNCSRALDRDGYETHPRSGTPHVCGEENKVAPCDADGQRAFATLPTRPCSWPRSPGCE